MSTLPFLLSVADELDNINSQSYMDDFGLGFHPHRQYYRTPTIQLSLPASTEWMQERQRCRIHRFVPTVDDETQNNFQSTTEADEDDTDADAVGRPSSSGRSQGGRYDFNDRYNPGASTSSSSAADAANATATNAAASTGGANSRQRYTSALNSNDDGIEENIDNSVQMYNLTKKCCKNYYRHSGNSPNSIPSSSSVTSTVTTPHTTATNNATATGGVGELGQCPAGHRRAGPGIAATIGDKVTQGGYKLHTKCMEGNNSSSEESLQKVSSPIEFLTCFLVKKTRAPKSSGGHSSRANADADDATGQEVGGGKKS